VRLEVNPEICKSVKMLAEWRQNTYTKEEGAVDWRLDREQTCDE
jgi:hypothetical protein